LQPKKFVKIAFSIPAPDSSYIKTRNNRFVSIMRGLVNISIRACFDQLLLDEIFRQIYSEKDIHKFEKKLLHTQSKNEFSNE
jgi:hypothetical protein